MLLARDMAAELAAAGAAAAAAQQAAQRARLGYGRAGAGHVAAAVAPVRESARTAAAAAAAVALVSKHDPRYIQVRRERAREIERGSPPSSLLVA